MGAATCAVVLQSAHTHTTRHASSQTKHCDQRVPRKIFKKTRGKHSQHSVFATSQTLPVKDLTRTQLFTVFAISISSHHPKPSLHPVYLADNLKTPAKEHPKQKRCLSAVSPDIQHTATCTAGFDHRKHPQAVETHNTNHKKFLFQRAKVVSGIVNILQAPELWVCTHTKTPERHLMEV